MTKTRKRNLEKSITFFLSSCAVTGYFYMQVTQQRQPLFLKMAPLSLLLLPVMPIRPQTTIPMPLVLKMKLKVILPVLLGTATQRSVITATFSVIPTMPKVMLQQQWALIMRPAAITAALSVQATTPALILPAP